MRIETRDHLVELSSVKINWFSRNMGWLILKWTGLEETMATPASKLFLFRGTPASHFRSGPQIEAACSMIRTFSGSSIAVALKALAKKPTARYQTAGELFSQLHTRSHTRTGKASIKPLHD